MATSDYMQLHLISIKNLTSIPKKAPGDDKELPNRKD